MIFPTTAALCDALLGKKVTVERMPKLVRHLTSRAQFNELVACIATSKQGGDEVAKQVVIWADPLVTKKFPDQPST